MFSHITINFWITANKSFEQINLIIIVSNNFNKNIVINNFMREMINCIQNSVKIVWILFFDCKVTLTERF